MPIEGWFILSWLVNIGWLVILAGYILQMFSTAARLVRAHINFCTSWVQTLMFAVLKA